METLKHDEDLLEMLRVDSNAVVSNGKDPFAVLISLGRDVDARRFGAAIFDGVFDQILEQLDQLRTIGSHGGQRIVRDRRVAVLDCALQIGESLFQCGAAGCFL